jgi:hypothetical protein
MRAAKSEVVCTAVQYRGLLVKEASAEGLSIFPSGLALASSPSMLGAR